MISETLKRTLLIYLAYAFFITSILTIICLLMEYAPGSLHVFQKFGMGGLVLNSILWSLLFTVAGSTSLFNQYEPVRNHFLLSLFCFLFIPSLIAIMVFIIVSHASDLFGFTEAASSFFIVQLFFFFRFRLCMKRSNSIAVD